VTVNLILITIIKKMQLWKCIWRKWTAAARQHY